MFTIPDCSTYISDYIAMGGLRKPSIKEQIDIDWDMAHSLDTAGDRYKAEGKLETAKVCYSRALNRAIRATEAQKKLQGQNQ